ncbi:EAL domain-containing protein [Enterobacter hormaechei]|uniref:EAL domain-containing protein n=1 Tax=Enterobacter hormaechei TaxID=158836 RepID=UPI00334A3D16
MQHISHDITGIKLEPIVALSSSRSVGAEVLSVLLPHQQSEGFFHDWSAARALMLLEAQIAALKKTFPCDNLFINLPITVLTIPEMFQRLLQLKSPPLNIELVEPASFFSLSDPARLRVSCALQQLTAQGHRIWLDDIDEASGRAFLSCRMPLSGIKIDKIAFWRLRATPALANLVTLCSKIAENVLIEGIETETDRKFALQAGARFGQGYYWPSWRWQED